jgi:hypothetical protein
MSCTGCGCTNCSTALQGYFVRGAHAAAVRCFRILLAQGFHHAVRPPGPLNFTISKAQKSYLSTITVCTPCVTKHAAALQWPHTPASWLMPSLISDHDGTVWHILMSQHCSLQALVHWLNGGPPRRGRPGSSRVLWWPTRGARFMCTVVALPAVPTGHALMASWPVPFFHS